MKKLNSILMKKIKNHFIKLTNFDNSERRVHANPFTPEMGLFEGFIK
jgi:hypothetical protein